MYDLKPVRLSARSNYVKFTDEMEQALSAQRHLDQLNAPVIVAYGTLETPEFQRQSPRFRRRGEGRRQAGRSSWSARATTTSRCPRRSPIPTACSAARCSSR